MSNNIKPHCFKKEPTPIEVEKGKTYAWCTCGLSEKNPFCNGKHKTLVQKGEDNNTFLPFKSLPFTAEKTETIWLCNCKATKTPPFCDGSHKAL